MKAVIQRVSSARVVVDGEVVGEIQQGTLVLLGVMKADDEATAARLAERLVNFRFFTDETGRMNRSLAEVQGAALVVSQVTLAADGKKGRRPSMDAAAPPGRAQELYLGFVDLLGERGIPTATGVFGAHMEVTSTNDGPVTFVLEEQPRTPAAGPRR